MLADEESDRALTWGACFLIVIRAATQQDLHLGESQRPPLASRRLLLVSLVTFTSLLATSYGSVLVSRLAVASDRPRFAADLASLAGALPPSHFLCVRLNSPVYSEFLMNGSTSELQPRWRAVVNGGPCHRQPRTTEHMAASVCKEGCVLFESDNIMSGLLARRRDDGRNCDIERPSPLRVYSHISILLRRGLQHAHLIKIKIATMRSTGTLQRLRERLLPIGHQLVAEAGGGGPRASAYRPIALGHVAAPLAAYAAAAAAAAALLAVEVAYARRRNTRRWAVQSSHQGRGK